MSSKSAYIILLTATVLILSMIGYLWHKESKLTHSCLSQIESSIKIRELINNAVLHSEKLVHDKSPKSDKAIDKALDSAEWHAGAMLTGGDKPEKTGRLSQVKDPRLRAKINEMKILIKELRVAIQEYVKNEKGADKEKKIYSIYKSIIAYSENIQKNINNRIQELLHYYNIIKSILFLAIMSTSLFCFVSFLKYSKERAANEKDLKESGIRFMELFNNMSNGVVVYEAIDNASDFIIKDINKSAEKLYCAKKEHITGRTASEAFPVLKNAALSDVLRKVWETGTPESVPAKEFDEGLMSFWANNYVYKLPTGEIVTVFNNLTELKKAELNLREREENLSITLNSIGDGVIATDTDGRITRMNFIAEELTGWLFEKAKGLYLQEVFNIINAETRKRVENPVEKALKAGTVVGLANHTILLARGGKEHNIADSGAPIKNSDGKIIGVILVFRNVTEQYKKDLALQRERARLFTVMEAIPAFVYLQDQYYSIKYANNRFKELFGDPEGRHCFEVIHGRTEPCEYCPTFDVFKTMEPRIREWKDKEKDKAFKVYHSFLPDVDGAPMVLKMGLDITESKKTETALRESEKTWRTLIEQSPIDIELFNLEGYQIKVNEAWEKMWNAKGRDGIGKFNILQDPQIKALNEYDAICRVFSGGEAVYVDDWLFYPKKSGFSGQKRHLRLCIYPIINEKKKVLNVVVICEDITARKEAEKELERTKSYLNNVINSMPSILIGVDNDCKITQWNAKAEKETGLAMNDVSGRRLDEVLAYMSGQMKEIYKAIHDKTPQKEQRRVFNAKGELFYSDIMVYPLVKNGVEGAVVRIDDVTEKVRLESMMIQTEKMMSVGGLAAGMAHEINNPLGVIMQGGENILRRLSPALPANLKVAEECGLSMAKMDEYLKKRKIGVFIGDIRHAALRASNIVKNMLQFSRRSEPYMTTCNISRLIDSTVNLAANDYDLKKKYDFRHIIIDLDYDSELVNIYCIETELQQVLLNLLKNAAQAISQKQFEKDEKPQITITTKKEGNFARIELNDNANGMDEQTRKRAFEPFFTTKEVGIGTGLGLSVSYFIITENHKGTLDMTTSKGAGTNFIIRIPLTENETS